jgi:adenylate cyclase
MHTIRKLTQMPVLISGALSLLVFGALMGLRFAGVMVSLELTAYDWLHILRPTALPESRVVLITIDDQDIDKLNQWPLTDATLAEALTRLSNLHPRAIGLDLYRHFVVEPGREELEAILTSNPRIIGITKFGTNTRDVVPPPTVLRGTEQVGFNDFIVDPGGIVRRGLCFLDDGQNVSYSLALRLALLYLKDEGITLQPDPDHPQFIRLGHTTIRPFESNDGGYIRADAQGYQFLLDFHGAPEPFMSFSLSALLAGIVPPEAIRDKVVIIGVGVTESVKDFFFTPYSQGTRRDQRMAGMTVHAHSVSQLLRAALTGDAMITSWSELQEALWILLWCVCGAAIGLWTHSFWRFAYSGVSGLVLLICTVYGAFLWGYWLPGVPALLGWMIVPALIAAYQSTQEKAQRVMLMHLFSQHVSPEVAETIWQQRERFLEGGQIRPQRLVASVLFTDLMGFTTVSERLTPQALTEWLNEYMAVMAHQVTSQRGVINKYIGDSIMALFGVPLARTTEEEIAQDAQNAVACALDMAEALKTLNRRWAAQQEPMIGMRVGIFTGPLVAGSVGSTQRLEYTVMGDTVNTASRLESFDKDVLTPEIPDHPCRILIGEMTARYVNTQFHLVRVGEVHLKGKDETVTIYHVLGRTAGDVSGLVEESKV